MEGAGNVGPTNCGKGTARLTEVFVRISRNLSIFRSALERKCGAASAIHNSCAMDLLIKQELSLSYLNK